MVDSNWLDVLQGGDNDLTKPMATQVGIAKIANVIQMVSLTSTAA